MNFINKLDLLDKLTIIGGAAIGFIFWIFTQKFATRGELEKIKAKHYEYELNISQFATKKELEDLKNKYHEQNIDIQELTTKMDTVIALQKEARGHLYSLTRSK